MASIAITAAATGFSPPTKTYTFTDQVMLDIIAAYQQDANSSINGTATNAQVLLFICNLWAQQLRDKVVANKTTPPVVPSPPVIS